MSDPAMSWRIVVVCAIIVLGAVAAACRIVALLRSELSLLAILRREHTRRSFGPDDFNGIWAWHLYRATPWLLGLVLGLLILLLVTRIFSRL